MFVNGKEKKQNPGKNPKVNNAKVIYKPKEETGDRVNCKCTYRLCVYSIKGGERINQESFDISQDGCNMQFNLESGEKKFISLNHGQDDLIPGYVVTYPLSKHFRYEFIPGGKGKYPGNPGERQNSR